MQIIIDTDLQNIRIYRDLHTKEEYTTFVPSIDVDGDTVKGRGGVPNGAKLRVRTARKEYAAIAGEEHSIGDLFAMVCSQARRDAESDDVAHVRVVDDMVHLRMDDLSDAALEDHLYETIPADVREILLKHAG